MKMTMTADEVREFMRELSRHCLDGDFDAHADYIGFIEGETYRGHWDTYRCVHRTACYATFEATDPRTGETVRFRSKVRVYGDGEPTAWVGYSEGCKPPFGERGGLIEYIHSTDIAC